MTPREAIANPSLVPKLVKRGVMNILGRSNAVATEETFERAFNIIVWRLTESGRLREGSLQLTSVGRRIERQSRTDRSVVMRIRDFDRVANRLAAQLRREGKI